MKTEQKITLSSIIFGIVTAVFIIFLIYPLFNEIKKSSLNFISEKNVLAELEAKIKNLKTFQTFYKENQSNLEKIDKVFIDPETPIDFIKFLEKEAHNSQLSIEIAPGSSQKLKEDPWLSLNFQLSLSGKPPNFLRFLEKLESASYLIESRGFSIKRLTKQDIGLKAFEGLSVGDISATLLIKVYANTNENKI